MQVIFWVVVICWALLALVAFCALILSGRIARDEPLPMERDAAPSDFDRAICGRFGALWGKR